MVPEKTEIEGVLVGRNVRHSDQRGWLTELFRLDELPNGFKVAMGYMSLTRPGESRGPHQHKEQSDCLVFPGVGHFEIYLWDNRAGSLSFNRHIILRTDETEALIVIIPPGVVHGYKNIGRADGFSINTPDRLYAGFGRKEAVDEIRYEGIPGAPFKIT